MLTRLVPAPMQPQSLQPLAHTRSLWSGSQLTGRCFGPALTPAVSQKFLASVLSSDFVAQSTGRSDIPRGCMKLKDST